MRLHTKTFHTQKRRLDTGFTAVKKPVPATAKVAFLDISHISQHAKRRVQREAALADDAATSVSSSSSLILRAAAEAVLDRVGSTRLRTAYAYNENTRKTEHYFTVYAS